MKKLPILFALAGFIVAMFLGLLWTYLNSHPTFNPTRVPILGLATDWLWPTNIMLMAWHSDGWLRAFTGVLLSAAANAVLYSIVGTALAAALRWVRR